MTLLQAKNLNEGDKLEINKGERHRKFENRNLSSGDHVTFDGIKNTTMGDFILLKETGSFGWQPKRFSIISSPVYQISKNYVI